LDVGDQSLVVLGVGVLDVKIGGKTGLVVGLNQPQRLFRGCERFIFG
jgi:hypothetical protein